MLEQDILLLQDLIKEETEKLSLLDQQLLEHQNQDTTSTSNSTSATLHQST